MKLPKDKKFYVFGLFVLAEAAIYITFLIYDFAIDRNLIYLKYAGILTCLAFAAIGIIFYGKDAITVTAALTFTSISDLFILVLFKHLEAGLCTFIITQLIYFARIYLINGKKPYISLGVRAVAVAVSLIVLGALNQLNSAVVVLCCIYFPQLVINAAESAFLIKINKKYLLFFIGLVLFTLCDICVGTYNLSRVGANLPADIVEFARLAIWIFYLPAQVLIVLSERKTDYRPFFTKEKV